MKNRKICNDENFVQDVRFGITNTELHLLNEAEHIFGAEGPHKRRGLLIDKMLKPIMRDPARYSREFLETELKNEPSLLLVVPNNKNSGKGRSR